MREGDQGFLQHDVFIQRLKDWVGKSQNPSAVRRLVTKVLWMISVSRNSIVVIIGMILAYILEGYGPLPFKVTGTTSTIFLFLLVTNCFKTHYVGRLRLKCDGTRAETKIPSFGETDESI